MVGINVLINFAKYERDPIIFTKDTLKKLPILHQRSELFLTLTPTRSREEIHWKMAVF